MLDYKIGSIVRCIKTNEKYLEEYKVGKGVTGVIIGENPEAAIDDDRFLIRPSNGGGWDWKYRREWIIQYCPLEAHGKLWWFYRKDWVLAEPRSIEDQVKDGILYGIPLDD